MTTSNKASRHSSFLPMPAGHNPLETLRALHATSTPGVWGKGKSTHETVAHRLHEQPYKVADFRHADDAAFCDASHELVPGVVGILGSLLAIIHRDGGHYVAQHGLQKAFEDAVLLVHEARAQPLTAQGGQGSEPVAWFAFGDSNGPVPLELYGWDEKACKHAVLTYAREDQWKGSVEGYLFKQGWTLRPVYTHPPRTQGQEESQPTDTQLLYMIIGQDAHLTSEEGTHQVWAGGEPLSDLSQEFPSARDALVNAWKSMRGIKSTAIARQGGKDGAA